MHKYLVSYAMVISSFIPIHMATVASLYLPIFTFALLFISCAAGGQPLHRRQINLSSLLSTANCSSSSSSDEGYKMTVVHRHGPCYPLVSRKHLSHQRAHLLRQDLQRVQSLQHRGVSPRKNPGELLASVPSHSGLALGTAEFVVTVGFGTPKLDQSVIFDTGSDISWIQCQPCSGNCHPQKEPIFDPHSSTTLSPVSCDSVFCNGDETACALATCAYSVTYADTSATRGYLAQDTLTLTSSDVLRGFVFGCGLDNTDSFGEVAGLIGLGRDNKSLASQVSSVYGGGFSYCLPPFASSSGYLKLGPGKQSPNVQFTTLLSKPEAPSLYFMELVGLSVGGKQLDIPPETLAEPGTIIDSGTVITYLPADAYSALKAEFQRQMMRYPRAPPAEDVLDTCYNLSGYNRVTVPEVALQFVGGVSLNVDASGILFVLDTEQAIACLAFAAVPDPAWYTIIGNMQQKTYNVVYDVPRGMIGFGAAGCG